MGQKLNNTNYSKYLDLREKVLELKTLLDSELEVPNGHVKNGTENPPQDRKNGSEESLSYQMWIGELGKTIMTLHREIEKYKSHHTKEVEKNISLVEEVNVLKQRKNEFDKAVYHLNNLKEKANLLYDQFYSINELHNKNEKLLIIKLKNKFRNSSLFGIYSKLKSLLKAIVSFKFRQTIQEHRLFKKHDWEASFLRDSRCFDYYYFLSTNEDILQAEIDPIRHFVVKGFLEGRNPNAFFNTNWYLNEYADIKRSGENPFIHYLQKGILENRLPNPFFNPANLEPYLSTYDNTCKAFARFLYDQSYINPKTGKRDISYPVNLLKQNEQKYANLYHPRQIIYISGLVHNTSHQFRVTDQLNILDQLGYDATYISVEEVERYQHLLIFAEVVVIFRAGWSKELEAVIMKCKEAGVVIVYDTDDYVFDPGVANEKFVDGIRFLKESDVKLYHQGVLLYKRLMDCSDLGIFSTPSLAKAYKKLLQKEAFIIKNGFSDYFHKTSQQALSRNPEKTGTIILGYASGSLTHQKDFKIASPAIARILRENPRCKLRVVGMLKVEEFPEFEDCLQQIEILPVAPHHKLAYEVAEFDINLAPLEIGNPFCEAKSELKYFEAALVKVPTVASATEPYRMAIRQGINGYLAHSGDEWYEYLHLLVKDAKLRQSVAIAAYKDTMKEYSYEGKKRQVQEAFEQIYAYRKNLLKNNSFSRTVTFVLPEMSKGSGGHAKAISVAKGLAHFNHTITLNFIGEHKDYLNPEDIAEEFELDPRNIKVVYSDAPPSDSNIIFATFWKTVYHIENSKRWFGHKYHFLQDYEPFFYAMSTEYLLSINAMKKSFTKISYGPWIKEMIKKKHEIESTHIPFYINKNIYHQNDTIQRRENRILFFARPEMPRRCFELGWKALQVYRSKYGNDVEIVLFGSYAIGHIDIGFEHINLNVKSPKELAYLYQNATLGIAFSPTNPSMVPFEMMACGLPVLDLDVEGNEINYGGKENVFMVNPDAIEIADTINDILDNSDLRSLVSQNGVNFIRQLPTEKEAIHEIENILIAKD